MREIDTMQVTPSVTQCVYVCINLYVYIRGYLGVLAKLFKFVSTSTKIQWITDNLELSFLYKISSFICSVSKYVKQFLGSPICSCQSRWDLCINCVGSNVGSNVG